MLDVLDTYLAIRVNESNLPMIKTFCNITLVSVLVVEADGLPAHLQLQL